MAIFKDKKTDVNGTDVSTVLLPTLARYEANTKQYETCIFQSNGDSEVVQRYDSVEAAIRGHYTWVGKVYTKAYKPQRDW